MLEDRAQMFVTTDIEEAGGDHVRAEFTNPNLKVSWVWECCKRGRGRGMEGERGRESGREQERERGRERE